MSTSNRSSVKPGITDSIKDLKKDLREKKRGGSAPIQSEVVSKDDTKDQVVSKKTTNKESGSKTDVKSLQPLFDLIDQRDYSNEAIVGIDNESHEFLSLMKRKTGVKQYALVSYLIQEFYEKNQEELNALLSDKTERKFLNIK